MTSVYDQMSLNAAPLGEIPKGGQRKSGKGGALKAPRIRPAAREIVVWVEISRPPLASVVSSE